MKIIIVGAGISGCVCANRLAMAGHAVTLIEKGRGVGGRMSTRRMNGARIDHGAQFFTARDPRMKELVQDWEEQGLWFHGMIRCRAGKIFLKVFATEERME
jgi:predicted NAD/FAD-dependent oxidoreductase